MSFLFAVWLCPLTKGSWEGMRFPKGDQKLQLFLKNEPQHGNMVLQQLKHASVVPSSGQIQCYLEGKKERKSYIRIEIQQMLEKQPHAVLLGCIFSRAARELFKGLAQTIKTHVTCWK